MNTQKTNYGMLLIVASLAVILIFVVIGLTKAEKSLEQTGVFEKANERRDQLRDYGVEPGTARFGDLQKEKEDLLTDPF